MPRLIALAAAMIASPALAPASHANQVPPFLAVSVTVTFEVAPQRPPTELHGITFTTKSAPHGSSTTDLRCRTSDDKGRADCWFVGECATTNRAPRDYMIEAGRAVQFEGERHFLVTIKGCSATPRIHAIRYRHVRYSEIGAGHSKISDYERKPTFDNLFKAGGTGLAFTETSASGATLPSEWNDALKTYRDLSSTYLAASQIPGLAPEGAAALKSEADAYQARAVIMANAQMRLIFGNISAEIGKNMTVSGSLNDWHRNLQQAEQALPAANSTLTPAQRREAELHLKQLQNTPLDNNGFRQLNALSKLGGIM